MGFTTKLRNGSSVDSQRIKTFYDSWLKPLYNHDPNLALHLYLHAEDPDYPIPTETEEWFVQSGFLDDDGTLDADFRNVILSAISIDREDSTISIERPELPKTPPG